MYHSYAFIYCCLFACTLSAQTQPELLQVHLDPQRPPFNTDFIRNEIPFVDFVSDRRLADVQLQSWEEPLQNDAKRYRYIFYGYGRFAGQNDTVEWHAEPLENSISIRDKSLAAVKQGLLPFLVQTPLRQSLRYDIDPMPDNDATPDPWGRWTFNPGLQVYGFGGAFRDTNGLTGRVDNRRTTIYMLPKFSIWRIGNRWRAGFDAEYNSSRSRQKTTGGAGDYDNYSRVFSGDAYGVYSLTSRLSLGAGVAWRQLWSSTFNTPPQNTLGAAVEYNFLPYRDFFRRRLILGYNWQLLATSLKPYRNLIDGGHTLYFRWSQTGKWGFFALNSNWKNDLNFKEWNLFSLNGSVQAGVNVGKNVFLGCSLDATWGNSDYTYIALSGAPVVFSNHVRSLDYSFRFNIAYYFGSGYRNIVNPRQIDFFN